MLSFRNYAIFTACFLAGSVLKGTRSCFGGGGGGGEVTVTPDPRVNCPTGHVCQYPDGSLVPTFSPGETAAPTTAATRGNFFSGFSKGFGFVIRIFCNIVGTQCLTTDQTLVSGYETQQGENGVAYGSTSVTLNCGTLFESYLSGEVSQSTSQAQHNEIPWQVRLSIEMNDDDETRRTCGGVLLRNDTVLTSASCLADSISVKIFVGELNKTTSGGKQEKNMIKMRLHPRFKTGSSRYDLALLKMEEVTLTPGVLPICLPRSCQGHDSRLAGCVSTGWTTSFDDAATVGDAILQKGFSQLQTEASCDATLASNTRYLSDRLTRDNITEQFLCAKIVNGAKKRCQADNGGPLACKNVVTGGYEAVGLLAFHANCATARRNVDVYIRPCKFLPWINRHLDNETAWQ